MKIAVTYEGGNVFQHFGHSQYFNQVKAKRIRSEAGISPHLHR